MKGEASLRSDRGLGGCGRREQIPFGPLSGCFTLLRLGFECRLCSGRDSRIGEPNSLRAARAGRLRGDQQHAIAGHIRRELGEPHVLSPVANKSEAVSAGDEGEQASERTG
jgi:hypothetical protein